MYATKSDEEEAESEVRGTRRRRSRSLHLLLTYLTLIVVTYLKKNELKLTYTLSLSLSCTIRSCRFAFHRDGAATTGPSRGSGDHSERPQILSKCQTDTLGLATQTYTRILFEKMGSKIFCIR